MQASTSCWGTIIPLECAQTSVRVEKPYIGACSAIDDDLCDGVPKKQSLRDYLPVRWQLLASNSRKAKPT